MERSKQFRRLGRTNTQGMFESAVISLPATKNQTQTVNLMLCKFDPPESDHAQRDDSPRRRKTEENVFEELSIDEKSFQKGHIYATVLSHPSEGRVLEVEKSRTQEACIQLMKKALTAKQLKNVKKIRMDMRQSFVAVAKERLPNAEVVHDKFHLIKYPNEAIDKVRKREVKTHAELKDSRYAMLKNEENLTAKQRIKFEEIRSANFEVSRAWQARENFKEMFKNASIEAQWRNLCGMA